MKLLPPPLGSELEGEENQRSSSVKKKIILGGVLFLLAASLVGAVLLVKRSQETRREAAGENKLVCKRWSGGLPAGYVTTYGGGQGKINFYANPHYSGSDKNGEVVFFRCDYRKAIEKTRDDQGKIHPEKLVCTEDTPGFLAKDYKTIGCGHTDPRVGDCYTPGIDSFVDPNFMGGKCQVIQLDLRGCNTERVEVVIDGKKRKYPGWHGGTAFIVAYNPECPTPSPTATPTLTPTPTPVPSCREFSLTGGEDSNGDGIPEYIPGQSNMGIRFKTENAGLRDYRMRKQNDDGSWGEWTRVRNGLALGDGRFPFTAPTEPGRYEIGVNVFNAGCDNSTCNSGGCTLVCSVDNHLYRVTDCNYGGFDGQPQGNCQNECRQQFDVVAQGVSPSPRPSPSPSPTPAPGTLTCQYCHVYNENWEEISPEELPLLEIGQKIYFATTGNTDDPQGITKARFRITVNGEEGEWQETTQQNDNGEFYISYTIPETGSYKVEAMVYNPNLGWQ